MIGFITFNIAEKRPLVKVKIISIFAFFGGIMQKKTA
jgi:hypothetical protein